MSAFGEAAPVAAAVIGAVAGIVGTSFTYRKQLEHGIATELQARRLGTYPELWAALEPLSVYPPTSVSADGAAELAEALKSWYYKRGGFFLSCESRKRYTDLQELIAGVTPNSPKIPDEMRGAASALRTAMTEDCSTRTRSHL